MLPNLSSHNSATAAKETRLQDLNTAVSHYYVNLVNCRKKSSSQVNQSFQCQNVQIQGLSKIMCQNDLQIVRN